MWDARRYHLWFWCSCFVCFALDSRPIPIHFGKRACPYLDLGQLEICLSMLQVFVQKLLIFQINAIQHACLLRFDSNVWTRRTRRTRIKGQTRDNPAMNPVGSALDSLAARTLGQPCLDVVQNIRSVCNHSKIHWQSLTLWQLWLGKHPNRDSRNWLSGIEWESPLDDIWISQGVPVGHAQCYQESAIRKRKPQQPDVIWIDDSWQGRPTFEPRISGMSGMSFLSSETPTCRVFALQSYRNILLNSMGVHELPGCAWAKTWASKSNLNPEIHRCQF